MEREAMVEDYKAVLNAIYCRILIFSTEGKLVHYNDAADQMFRDMDIDLKMVLDTNFSEFTDILRKEVDMINGSGRFHIVIHSQEIICNIYPWMVGDMRKGSVLILHEYMHPNCIEQVLGKTSNLLKEMNAFIDSSNDGFMVTDRNGIIIKVNAALEKALSLKRKDIIGQNAADLVANGILLESAALKVIQTGESATAMISKDGKKLISTGSPVYDEFGEWVSVVVNIRDITELNDLQNKLEYQQMVAEGYVRELSYIQSQNGGSVIANSKAMQKIMDTIKALSLVDSTILITGESGTGKEVVANQIYKSSYRYDKPFMKINCGAIPANLFESELFGYEDGAFTGARKKGKAGFFELCNGGTLFLDEIGELDMNLQVKLLRVLQEGEVTRIGGTKTVHVDVRLIAATNKDLEELVQNGQFRADLYYRLNVVNIEVPPLRNRRDDIIPLTQHFLDKYNKKYNKTKMLSMELGKLLRELEWPGNIRELENMIENMVVLAPSNVLRAEDMPGKYREKTIEIASGKISVQGILPLNEAIQQMESQLLRNAAEQYTSTREIAKALGVNQSTISRKLGKLKKEDSK